MEHKGISSSTEEKDVYVIQAKSSMFSIGPCWNLVFLARIKLIKERA